MSNPIQSILLEPEVLEPALLREHVKIVAAGIVELPDPSQLMPDELRAMIKEVSRVQARGWFWLSLAFERVQREELWSGWKWEDEDGNEYFLGSFRDYIECDLTQAWLDRSWNTARSYLSALGYLRKTLDVVSVQITVPDQFSIRALSGLYSKVFDSSFRERLVKKGFPASMLPTEEQWRSVHDDLFAGRITGRHAARICAELGRGIDQSRDDTLPGRITNDIYRLRSAIMSARGDREAYEAYLSGRMVGQAFIDLFCGLIDTIGRQGFNELVKLARKQTKSNPELEA